MYLGGLPYLVLSSDGQGNRPQDRPRAVPNTNSQEDKMAWLGMNLETVQGEIPKWNQLAEDINTIITTVNTQVQQANEAWNGKDSDDFIQDWEGQHRPALEKIKGLIENLHQQLQGDVQQQTEASSS